jgi:hypothetical protein
MTVDSFGVQSVQAVATMLMAAFVLLGAVLLALVTIAEGAHALAVIVVARAPGRLTTHRASFRPPRRRFAASLPSRAPPLSFHRPDRTPQELRDEG